MKNRLPKNKYKELKEFKKKVNSERANKLVRDHQGNLYRTNKDGSIQRCGRDDLIELSRNEDVPGVERIRTDT